MCARKVSHKADNFGALCRKDKEDLEKKDKKISFLHR
jgi:hypothetical protein